MPSSRPQDVARYTVEQNGGEYVTDVPDLLSLFAQRQLNDATRREIRVALQGVGLGTDPDLFVAQESDPLRLFLLQERAVAQPGGWSTQPGLLTRIRPRSWKGWTVYGCALLLVIGAINGGSDDGKDPVPAAETVEQASPPKDDDGAVRKAARRERAQLRRQRAQLKRERAQVRRARAHARR